ncbi:N-acetylglucosamine-6-phosphate deacetylase [Enterovibrio paralichthyis]|uniref:N-acetylglucosamine-6-phosphate deacetylase n=1 Tax=Enterovibrio paralichthyis TaxID=2853805 RepID=UPI00210622E4|nr:N-acetylglucosamine-6-phosphate deacetylase [Enterovibrio paralichthyis]
MVFNRRYRRILTPANQWLDDAVIGVENGRITRVQPYSDYLATGGEPLEMQPVSLMPGLIDSHIHGAMGFDVMDASHEALDAISAFLASQGVVAFLATTVTAPVDKIRAALRAVKHAMKDGVSGAAILGSYLEGPYFTALHRGAHPESFLRELDEIELEHWLSVADGTLKCVALAPEKNDALKAIAYLKAHQVNVMLAHTSASYEQTVAALRAGADGIVHCYNGMTGLHHREPGVVGAALCCDSAHIELIADGHHVHPAAAEVVWRCAANRMVLVSDAMRATGMPDGEYALGELNVTMKAGVVRTENGGLAGSTLTLNTAVSNLSQWFSLPFEKAWSLASMSPATLLGVENDLGSLAPGKLASMVEWSDAGEVVATWVAGNCVYRQTSAQHDSVLEAVCI